jgi:hypothetical protein
MSTGEQQDAGGSGTRRRRLVWLGALLLIALAIAVPLATTVFDSDSAAAPPRGTPGDDVLRGTSGPDVINGRTGNDRILGLAGADRLIGGPGDDALVGGRGADDLLGGRGDDELTALDGFRDKLYCGQGFDRVVSSDANDQLFDCELVDRDLPVPSGSIVLEDQPWTCRGPVNLDLVKVTIRTVLEDAIYLREDCSGYIGRIEVETWTLDGVKVNAPAPAAHDLVIGGGYIRCYDHPPEAHQDGVQIMGGERITFRRLQIECTSEPNAQFFLSGGSGEAPTQVVCERCFLGSGAATTLFVAVSVESGARNTLICPGRFASVRVTPEATDAVDVRNTVLAATDPRCTGSG